MLQLFVGELLLRNLAEVGEKVGHEPRLTGRPVALGRARQSLQRLLLMDAGLILNLGGAAFDHHFEQVERPFIDIGFGAWPNRGDALDDLVGGGFVADFVEHRLHALHERVDARSSVANDCIG